MTVPAVETADISDHSLRGGVSGRPSASASSLGRSSGVVHCGAIDLELVKCCRLPELLDMVESLKMLESLELFVGKVVGHGQWSE